MDTEKVLRQYQETKDFSGDYQRKEIEFFANFHVLPDDLTIEHVVLKEKGKELEERRKSV